MQMFLFHRCAFQVFWPCHLANLGFFVSLSLCVGRHYVLGLSTFNCPEEPCEVDTLGIFLTRIRYRGICYLSQSVVANFSVLSLCRMFYSM